MPSYSLGEAMPRKQDFNINFSPIQFAINMQTLRIVFKPTSSRILAFLCGVTFFFASCEKVPFEEGTTEESAIEAENISLEEQSNILQQVYKLPTREMGEAQIRSFYNNFVSETRSEERALLKDQLALLEANQATSPQNLVRAKSGETILSPAGASSDFGYGVASNRSHIIVGDAGEVSIYTDRGSRIDKTQSLSIPNNAGTILSSAGDWIAVGHPGSPQNNWEDGKVILFKNERGTWVEKQTINSPGGVSFFGEDVAMDLKTMAVLARGTVPSTSEIVYFRYNGSAWTETGRMGSGNFFWDIDMHRGRVVGNGFVGSDFFNPKVYIYTPSFGRVREETIAIPGALSRQISINNNTIIASVLFKPFFAGTNNTAYVFTSRGRSWNLSAELTIPVPFNTAAQGLGLKVEGKKALVSLPVFNYCCGSEEGDAVFVYEGSGSNWHLSNTLTPSDDNGLGSIYGTETGLAIHGSKILVGAPSRFGAPGKLYVH